MALVTVCRDDVIAADTVLWSALTSLWTADLTTDGRLILACFVCHLHRLDLLQGIGYANLNGLLHLNGEIL